jgi:hypothetical protein
MLFIALLAAAAAAYLWVFLASGLTLGAKACYFGTFAFD